MSQRTVEMGTYHWEGKVRGFANIPLSEATFRPSGASGKTQWIVTFLPFRAPASSFFWLFLFSDLLSSSLLFSSLLFSDSSHLCFSICPYCRVWLLNFLWKTSLPFSTFLDSTLLNIYPYSTSTLPLPLPIPLIHFYSALLYCPLPYSAPLCVTLLYSTHLSSSLLYAALLCSNSTSTLLCSTLLY